MKSKKIWFVFVAVLILCISTTVFVACNKDTPPSESDFKEGDVIVKREENTVTEKEYDEAGNEVRSISHVETDYNVTYISNEASVIYLKGNKPDEMYISGYDGVPQTLSVKDLESKVYLDGNAIVVKGVTEKAFYGCETLTSVDLEKERINALTFAIGDNAFANCSALTTLALPSKVYTKSGSIGQAAFANCESLTDVVIPDRFKHLGNAAFANCINLASVTFNDGVTKIPTNFLYGCEKLASIMIPTSVNYVGENAFEGCRKLTSITFPDSVTYVGSGALADCISLESIKIPFIGTSYSPLSGMLSDLFGKYDSGEIDPITEESYLYPTFPLSGNGINRYIPKTLTSIEVTNATCLPNYAFAGLSSLTSLSVTYSTANRIRVYGADNEYTNYDIPTITSVGNYAFADLKNISSFSIPQTATGIGSNAFAGTGLGDDELLGILTNVKSVGRYAFSNLENVTSVAIPQSVASVASGAFANNSNMTAFLSTANTALSSGVLAGCAKLKTVSVPHIGTSTQMSDMDDNIVVVSEGNAFATLFSSSAPSDLYNEDGNSQYYSVTISSGYTSYYIPNTLYTIRITGAIDIPNYAFYGILAHNIGITFNKGLMQKYDIDTVSIGSYAFYGCENLTTYTFDQCIDSIGNFAFANTSLTSVNVPATVKAIGNNAFANCKRLLTFNVKGNDTALSSGVLAGCTTLQSVTLPYIGTAYRASDGYSDIESLTYNNNAFATLFSSSAPSDLYDEYGNPQYYYTSYYIPYTLDNIKITDAVTIPSYAFAGIFAHNITVSYDQDITGTTIGSYAFNGCENLTSFTVDSSVRTIGNYAFANTSLTSISVPATVNTIENNAFANCKQLSTFNVKGNDTALSSGVLAGCTALQSVTLPYIGTAYWTTDSDSGFECLAYNDNAFATLFSSSAPSDLYDEYGNPQYYYTSYYVPNTLDSITITDAVTIPNYAFRSILAHNIAVSFDQYLTDTERMTIGSYAFYYCENLTSFTIDSCVRTIGNYAFANSGLESITVPENVENVSSTAFDNCADLTDFTWNAKYASVPDLSKINIDTLAIGDNVLSIQSGAFSNMSSLTTVTASGITSIGSGAFSNTPWLQNQAGAVYLGKVLYTYNGTVIGDFSVESGTVAIEANAFNGQSSLTDIYIPESITRIGSYAFVGCTSLDVVLFGGTRQQFDEIDKSSSGLSDIPTFCEAVNSARTYKFSSGEAIVTALTKSNAKYLDSLPSAADLSSNGDTHEADGYVLYGWYETSDFSGERVSAPYYNKNATTTLYARWLTEEEYDALIMDGSSFERAMRATVGQLYDVNITTSDQKVYFSFIPTETRSYTIEASDSISDNYGYLYNSAQNQITSDDDSAGNGCFRITRTLTAGETYYICAKMYSSSTTGSFKISIT